MGMVQAWRQRARQIKRETYALYLACRDPRTPWYARAVVVAVVAYALSPIDLIPDFIPVLGYLDDMILVPIGIAVAIKLIPPPVLEEARDRARAMVDRPTSRTAGFVIVGIWLVVAGIVIRWGLEIFQVI